VIEGNRQQARLLRVEQAEGLSSDLGLGTSDADGAFDLSGRMHQEHRAGSLRRRPSAAHHGAQRAGNAGLDAIQKRLQQLELGCHQPSRNLVSAGWGDLAVQFD